MRRFRAAAVLTVVLAAALLPLLGAGGARAAAPRPRRTVGILVSNLYNLSPGNESFSAKFDLWTTCRGEHGLDPLTSLDFSDTEEVAEEALESRTVDGERWTILTATATFHHGWEVDDFPFDRHRLDIRFHLVRPEREQAFTVDREGSLVLPDINLGDYAMTGFEVAPAAVTYPTALGNPADDSAAGRRHSGLLASVHLRRAHYAGFLTAISPLYIAVAFTAITFLTTSRDSDVMLARLGLAGSGLFAVVINMQVTHSQLGTSGLGLSDVLHIAGLAFVIVAVAATVACWQKVTRMEHVLRLKQLNRKLGLAAVALYVLFNAAVFVYGGWWL